MGFTNLGAGRVAVHEHHQTLGGTGFRQPQRGLAQVRDMLRCLLFGTDKIIPGCIARRVRAAIRRRGARAVGGREEAQKDQRCRSEAHASECVG